MKLVEKTSWHYKLEYGKYKRDGSKLYVQEATRYLLNKHLNNLLAQDPAESLGDNGGGEGKPSIHSRSCPHTPEVHATRPPFTLDTVSSSSYPTTNV